MKPSGHAGGCHCGALRWRFGTTKPLQALNPRACDCDFCSRHRAAWVSDPQGWLLVHARDGTLRRFRQGSEQAEFLLCGDCGVLAAVTARVEDGRLLGAANRNAFEARGRFADETSVSPRMLTPEVKLARWAQLWMLVEVTIGR